jgi:hypothetical protein
MCPPRVAALSLICHMGLLALLAPGCGTDTSKIALNSADGGDNDGSAAPSCDPAPVTYASFGRTFVDTYCSSCHDFNQALIQGTASLIYSVAVADGDNSRMPPTDPLPTLDQRMRLGLWLNCGAP